MIVVNNLSHYVYDWVNTLSKYGNNCGELISHDCGKHSTQLKRTYSLRQLIIWILINDRDKSGDSNVFIDRKSQFVLIQLTSFNSFTK